MAANFKERGWLGIQLESDDQSGAMTVTKVEPNSPAQAAGFKGGDRLVALNGIEFSEENRELLFQAKQGNKPGKQVTYKVDRNGAVRNLTVTLSTVPDEVLAQWIGSHMLDHAAVEIAQN